MGYILMYQIEDAFYPVLAAIGVPVNLVTIVILARGNCGLSKCIMWYLVGMAVADLLVVIMDPILTVIVVIYFPYSFLRITPVCTLVLFFGFAVTVVSVWLTVAFTFDRFVMICCEKMKTKYCTEKTAAVVVGVVGVLGILEALPWYFTIGPQYMVDNVPMSCANKPSFFTSTAWGAYQLFHFIFSPVVPFFLILLLNILTVRHILVASRARRQLQGCNNRERHKDPVIESRRKSIILLFSISGSFVLLWVTRVVYNIYTQLDGNHSYSTYTDPRFITERVSLMLQLLSSCTNTCIYAVTQTKFREELKNGVKFPLCLIMNLCSSQSRVNGLRPS
ncbi:probable G-protein coupled receptor 139 [Stegostoma tigrinum]|uniref:probable G-protein coupled receptor 139 n=1 Tax=Stegostoma tigrinum TaxID=3053191 RepID=UPI00202B8D3B|nr:probable G-protein coupled receptor 139 [Stegostoma tigrinum]